MKRTYLVSAIVTLIVLFQSACNNEAVLNDKDNRGTKSGARTAAQALSFHKSGRYGGSGYYSYPNQSLEFGATCNGSAVNVLFTPEDVPNRFIIRDNNGNVVAQSGQQSNTSGHNGYIGTTNNSGPWGGSFSTGGSESVSFTYNSSNTYTLYVETTVQDVTDSWSVDYTTSTCEGPIEPPTCTKGNICGQSLTGSTSSSGYSSQSRTIDLSNNCPGSGVYVLFTPQSVPNRFIIRNSDGTVVAESGQQSNTSGHNGYIGTTSNQGPWGGPFSTGGSENASFLYEAGKTYTLYIETVVQGTTDSWQVDIHCQNG